MCVCGFVVFSFLLFLMFDLIVWETGLWTLDFVSVVFVSRLRLYMNIAPEDNPRVWENIKLFFSCYPTAKRSTYWLSDMGPDDENNYDFRRNKLKTGTYALE